MRLRTHYEPDADTFSADAYSVPGDAYAIAYRVLGWETEPTADTEWDGIEERTGKVVAHMIGDDRLYVFDVDDLAPLDELAYCAECGQIGCAHDGRDRTEDFDDAAELARQRAEDELLPIQPEGHP